MSKPKIRFKGFTDDWEQRKFSDLVTIERGGSPRPIDKYITNDKNGLNWIKIGDAPEQGNYITQTAEKIKPEGLAKTRKVHPGDLILSNSMSFGRPYIMAIDGCIHDGWLAIRDTEKNFDLKFLCTLLGTDSMFNQYKSMAAGSTVNNLNKELVGGTKVLLPIMNEQVQIGQYFFELDNIITLHQRKYDKLVNIKKSMLEKMFPQNGASVPEIRFKEFTDDWEQREISEYANFFTGNGLNWNDIVADGKKECILYGNLYTDYGMIANSIVYKTNAEVNNAVYSEYGDVLIPASDTTPTGLARATSLEKSGVLLGGDINIVRPNRGVNGSCLSLAINANKKELIRLITGTTVRHIHNSDIKDIVICLPKNENEQIKITNYFKLLDNLITLHQRKIEKLKNIKKSCLEKMFV